MSRISVRAILIGGIVDTLLTLVLLLPIMAWVGVGAGVFELPDAQQSAALARAFEENYGAYIAGVLLGSMSSMVGGYVAARIADRAHLLNGALSAWFCFVLTVYGVLFDRSSLTSLWYLLFLPLGPALAALGGAEARRRLRKPRPPVAPVKRVSIGRRILITLLYLVIAFFSLAATAALMISSPCLETDFCTPAETTTLTMLGLGLLVLGGAILVAGPLGWLPGARSRRRLEAHSEMTGA